MIKKLLGDAGIEFSDKEFIECMNITTENIKEKRIKHNKKTSFEQVINMMIRTILEAKNCNSFDVPNICKVGD